MKAHRR